MSETFVVNQIQYAIDLGYKVSLIIGKFNKDNTKFFSSFFKQKSLEINLIDYSIPKFKIIRLLKWLKILMFNLFRSKEIIKFYQYSKSFSLSHLYIWYYYHKIVKKNDIVHVQFGTKAHPMDFFKKFYSFKLIVSFHGHDAFFPIGHIQQKGYYDLLFKVADIINTNTKYLTNQLMKIGCPKKIIREIPVAVDVNKFKRQFKEKENKMLKLLNVGRLHTIKGQKFLIELMSKVKKYEQDIIMTIVGTGELKKEYEDLIEKENLQSYVKMVGAKTQQELKKIYNEHDVFLFSSIPYKSREESQGLVCLEAQASGLPIIAFDSGGVKYTFKNNQTGFLCSIYNVEKMYKKVCFFYENREQVLELGLEGRKFVKENFSEDIIKNKWRKIYQ